MLSSARILLAVAVAAAGAVSVAAPASAAPGQGAAGHYDQQVPAPNPGTGDKCLGGISAAGTSAWAVGYFKTNISRSPLIEVHKPR